MQLKRCENITMVTLTYKIWSEIESTCVSFLFFHFHEHNVFQATLRKTLPKTKTKKNPKNKTKQTMDDASTIAC